MQSLWITINNKHLKHNIQQSPFLKKTSLAAMLVFFILHISFPGYGEIQKYTLFKSEYFQNTHHVQYGQDNQYLKNNLYIQYHYSDYLATSSDYSDSLSEVSSKQSEMESPLRRFEITFFLSAPFVFIITFITLHTYDVVKKQNPNVNVWKDFKPALLTGTFSISTAIAAREAYITWDTNNKNKNQSFNEQTFYFYASKNF